jgi:UDP-glucose 4-epimerase
MNILITGGYGFIGKYLTDQLIAEGHRVFIYDSMPTAPDGFADTTNIRGDLLNQSTLFDAIYSNKIDRLVNLAALRNNDSQKFPYTAFRVNCEGFVNCLEAARVFGLERVVYASSVAVLGNFDYYRQNGYDQDRLYALPEFCAKYPTNVYGATKLFNEQLGEQYSKIYGLRVLGARLPLIFGTGKKSGSKTGVFNEMIRQSYEGKPMSVDLRPDKFNLIYVKDAAHGLYCCAMKEEAKSGVYNICGATTDMYEYANAIKGVLPQAMLTIKTLDAPAAPVNTCMDPSIAKTEIGYEPQFDLASGIRDYAKMMGNQ